jgi:predicted ATPase
MLQNEADAYLKTKHNNLSNQVRVEITPKGAGYYASDYIIEKPFGTLLKVVRISTFDNFVKDARTANFIANTENIETDLDWDLRQVMSNFKSYQLTIKQRESEAMLPFDAKIAEISQKTAANIDELKVLQEILREKQAVKQEVHKFEDRLFEVLNEMFSNSETPELSKRIGAGSDNDFIFAKPDKNDIQLFQLSSGEKQLLILLMNAVLLNEKPSILLLDEPETSLHILWQEVFLDKVRYLAPNAQIIMATHGSDIFIEDEWYNKTSNIKSLFTKI